MKILKVTTSIKATLEKVSTSSFFGNKRISISYSSIFFLPVIRSPYAKKLLVVIVIDTDAEKGFWGYRDISIWFIFNIKIDQTKRKEKKRKTRGGGGGSDCSTVQASDPELEGWLIETCGNGDVTWISPSGKRCVANEQAGTTACEGSPPIRVN
jgi:hypothetical protein